MNVKEFNGNVQSDSHNRDRRPSRRSLLFVGGLALATAVTLGGIQHAGAGNAKPGEGTTTTTMFPSGNTLNGSGTQGFTIEGNQPDLNVQFKCEDITQPSIPVGCEVILDIDGKNQVFTGEGNDWGNHTLYGFQNSKNTYITGEMDVTSPSTDPSAVTWTIGTNEAQINSLVDPTTTSSSSVNS